MEIIFNFRSMRRTLLLEKGIFFKLPAFSAYGPLNLDGKTEEFIVMEVEELETIRLIDLEGLEQEQCAEQMNGARSTVQRIYNGARKKIADSLVNGNGINRG
jgi:predicted DNA-binding protein (UPF0251 family)